MTDLYEAVIGIEVHVELATETKIFCGCRAEFGAPPNTNACPVCMGYPGTLPSLNKKAVDMAIKAGLALGCKIANVSRFDRKNYFYPDLPKAYQISQNEFPICYDGALDVTVGGEKKRVRIKRIHLEEDAGKLLHRDGVETLIDYNRCGVPLIEIVSEPDLRTSAEAKAYLTELRTALLYTGISDCRMNEGSLRCDVNVSVRKHGSTEMGVRTEIKNVNSFAFAAKAIDYEIGRQIGLVEGGEEVSAETRRFDEASGTTVLMREKESAADYRYFPEPDIPPLYIDATRVERIKKELPILPAERRSIYTEKYRISADDARILTSSLCIAEYFESAAKYSEYPSIVANILLCDVLARTSADDFEPFIGAEYLCEIAELYGSGVISSSSVKKLLKLLDGATLTPRQIVEREGLAQINDTGMLEDILRQVLEQDQKLVTDYKNGKSAARKAIIGRAMAKSEGRANPVLLQEIFDRLMLTEKG